MSFFTKIFAALSAILGFAVAFLGMRAKQKDAEAQVSKTNMKIATESAKVSQSVANAVVNAEKRHQKEKGRIDAEVSNGKRDYFNT